MFTLTVANIHTKKDPKALRTRLTTSTKAVRLRPGLLSENSNGIIDERRARRTGSLAMALPNFRSTTDLLPGGLGESGAAAGRALGCNFDVTATEDNRVLRAKPTMRRLFARACRGTTRGRRRA